MPNSFHRLQMYLAAGLLVMFAILYVIAPAAKSEALAGALGVFTGFLTGKFSNGFAPGAKEGNTKE